ncbi:radical SAM protein [Candidatus Woesearchaeota archaeon]|nr:radical SAM protein [Candidatus Woesearchaeota archaeon]
MGRIQKTRYYSYKIGKLAKGCQLCVQGKKEVVFITGLCSSSCYYCPISDQKRNIDVVYANEWPVQNLKQAIEEANLCSSGGAGITGGDPLDRLGRTIKIIRMLKKAFGKKFHIHLYTPLNKVSANVLKKLEGAGLDEIRFHPVIGNKNLWPRILYKTKMKKGIEIPVIPNKEKETKELIRFIDEKVDFLNLNELEVSDAKGSKLFELGFKTKNRLSYGVKGSEELAKKLLKFCSKNTKLNVHYCTTTLKDKIQLANRIKRRAKNIKKEYDTLTKDGSLVRGAIYFKNLTPTFSYNKKVSQLKNKKALIKKLEKIRNSLIKEFSIPKNLISVDNVKMRLLTNLKVVHELKKELKRKHLVPAVVEELPTYDEFEIENEFL